MSVSLNWESKCTGQSKIGKFDGFAIAINEKILWFEVTMENTVLMQVDESLQNLVEETLCFVFWKRLVSELSHVLLQIEFNILEHQV